MSLLGNETKRHRARLPRLRAVYMGTVDLLKGWLHKTIYEAFVKHSDFATKTVCVAQKQVLRRKFNWLQVRLTRKPPNAGRNVPHATTESELTTGVINLSSSPLSEREKTILKEGLNFVPTPKQPPFLDIIAPVEDNLSSVDPQKATRIRRNLSTLIRNHRFSTTPSLSRYEMNCLQLKRHFNRIIAKADKGNRIVTVDRSTYIEKMTEILNTNKYTPLSNDPTEASRRNRRSLLVTYATETKEPEIIRLAKHLRFASNYRRPELYGLPKVHKPGDPFRPIVSTINSATSELCR
ncbi:hypothetical protein M513_09258 [Trichuris suis]|uniref:Uncharacterized protein n=1 Tax=Trichuris suis TaxID=68888 RepID=A0A085LXU5_9BILA|nr:hypothetical protein M513_09258 [Trichuris suis]